MTQTKQDIMSDFYSGNTKNIRVAVTDSQGQVFPLTSCEMTYALFNDKGQTFVKKSSAIVGEIEIDISNTHICIIHLLPADTNLLSGLYRHMLNVVDTNGQEETVMTGTVQLFKSYAMRYRSSTRQAYTIGV